MPLFRILSIDGGGMRGIIPATLLIYLEKCLQENSGNPTARLVDYFDPIAGTSTGGILTALYLTPDKHNRPRYSATDAFNFYKDYGSVIFYKSFWHTFKTLNGFLGSKYSSSAFKELLLTFFGSLRLMKKLKLLFSAQNIDNNYLRIQGNFTSLGYPEHALDNVNPSDLNKLYEFALQVTEDYKDKLNTFSQRLITQE